MQTIKEITTLLKNAIDYEEWMAEIEKDERIGVQKAWKRWKKQYEKRQEILKEHDNKVKFDKSFLSSNDALLAGIDEAGRGPLAGPVVTSAVILPYDCDKLIGINDSKQLTREERRQFAQIIKECAIDYAIHFQSADCIDKINIYEATKLSMIKSIQQLKKQPNICLIDAMELSISIPQQSIIKGDAKSLAIAAASILAKDARDEYMDQLHKKYPMYGFDKNAGYGTKQHLDALEQYGPIDEHRKSFEPIKSMIQKKE